MEETPLQMRTLIHHILYRHKIYRLEMNQIQEVLYLLQQRPTQKPQQIQELIFKGVIEFNLAYGDNVGNALSQEKFNTISNQSRVLMHKVLHEFFFLNSIRAFEMFQPYFQQPALHSMSERGEVPNQLLDDQFEKKKLHYMYYGPLSVYNFNQVTQPYYNNMAPSTFAHYDPVANLTSQTLLNTQNIQNQPPKARGRPPLNTPKPPVIEQPMHSEAPGIKIKNSNRGRPPKLKKIMDERVNIQSLQQQQIQLRMNVMEYQKQEQNKLLVLQQCICKGLKRSAKMNNCVCGRRFHLACSQDQSFCFKCKQLRIDPFYRVVAVIGSFVVDFQKNVTFQGTIDLQPFRLVFQHQQNYQIMVNSANPSFSGVCWPDDIKFSLNGRQIFEVPALLLSHNRAKRTDTFLNITSYIRDLMKSGNNNSLIRFKIQVKPYSQDQKKLRRNNRSGQFLIDFFLVNTLTPNDLIKEIEQKNSNPTNILLNNTNKHSFNTQKDCVLQKQFLSLIDPYSCQLIDLPAKGSKCTHLRCFDLKNYINLMYSMQTRKWECPFCHKDVRDLVIDHFSLNLLKEMRRNQKISNRVLVYSNGRVQYGESEAEVMDQSQRSHEQ